MELENITKWNKSVTEKQILHILIFMLNLKKVGEGEGSWIAGTKKYHIRGISSKVS